MEPQPLLAVENVSVAFDGRNILEHISFTVQPEEVLAVIGPNGSGKTVLLKTLIGLIKPARGRITWSPRARVGYLPQRFQVDRHLPMTVREFLRLKPTFTRPLEEALHLTRLTRGTLGKHLAHLSGGELQKVLLAWSIMDNPNLLLFDEPTENVDVVGQESIYSILHDLQDSLHVAVVLVSHDLHIVYRYATQVICINKRMVCSGIPHEVLTTERLSELYGDHAFFHHHHFAQPHE